MYLHEFWLGALLGWGAAIPIGPINLEIVRRNLNYGTSIGMTFGLSACGADITYVLLLCLGFINLLAHPEFLKIFGVLGSGILIYFAIQAFRLNTSTTQNTIKPSGSMLRNGLEGFGLTLLNPFTILFWASVSSQISLAAAGASGAVFAASIGVLFGTATWVIFLNLLIKYTRHRLSGNTMRLLNICGGVILIGFAAYGLWHAFGM
jgi:L-lysine exporter family protein LysE/ArgO